LDRFCRHGLPAGEFGRAPAGAGLLRLVHFEVTPTVEAGDGQFSYVEADGETYEAAKTAAETRIPEGSKAIAIRTTRAEE
jgi:hypothetical protein